MVAEAHIPKRAVFKAAEVCTIAGVQPYILRSWEAEFPTLARARKKGGARVYRRTDVEMVLQIKALVYGDGLTLGAAYRKLDAGKDPALSVDADEDGLLVGLFDSDARDRIVGVKQGLRGILELLSPNGRTVLSPAPSKTKDAVKKAPSARLPDGDKSKLTVKTAQTTGPAKTSTAAKATKTARPKKVAQRKRSA